MNYDSADYAGSRLIQTIVSYQGKPAVIQNTFGNPIQATIITSCSEELQVPLKELVVGKHKLGYVNKASGNCIYVERVPKRNDWRQGLRKRNCIGVTQGNREVGVSDGTIMNAMLGDYPSFFQALGQLKRECRIAFSRNYALDKDKDGNLSIYFRNRFKVATFSNGLLEVADQFKYLKGLKGVSDALSKG